MDYCAEAQDVCLSLEEIRRAIMDNAKYAYISENSVTDLCLCCELQLSLKKHAPAVNNVRSGAPDTKCKMDSKSVEQRDKTPF
jgi:hypothetical protein